MSTPSPFLKLDYLPNSQTHSWCLRNKPWLFIKPLGVNFYSLQPSPHADTTRVYFGLGEGNPQSICWKDVWEPGSSHLRAEGMNGCALETAAGGLSPGGTRGPTSQSLLPLQVKPRETSSEQGKGSETYNPNTAYGKTPG